MKDFEEEIVDNYEMLNIFNEIKMLVTEDIYKHDSIRDLKKDYPDKINEIEKTLPDHMG